MEIIFTPRYILSFVNLQNWYYAEAELQPSFNAF